MQAPLQATGNFGDLRDGRFHAGIDYSTFGKVGRPVYAVDDGWVWRVRCSGQGYGRSIYLQLKDGRFAVYGHLSRYAPKIDTYVWQRQDSSGEYEQDLQPPAGALAFKRGDVIGWSGESGDGPPHLHFEIRRGDMNLHPFLFGYVHPDTRAPSVAAVRVAPASAASRVAGTFDPLTVKLAPGTPARGPQVRGPFTLSVDTGDWADARATRKATYALRAWIDGGLVFEAVLDSFSWDDMPEAEYIYDLSMRRPQADDLRPLNAPPALRSGVIRRAQPMFDLTPGEHTIEIEAQDEAENVTRRSLIVSVARADAQLMSSAEAIEEVLGRSPVAALDEREGWQPRLRGSSVFVAARGGPSPGWPRIGGAVAARDSMIGTTRTVKTFELVGPATTVTLASFTMVETMPDTLPPPTHRLLDVARLDPTSSSMTLRQGDWFEATFDSSIVYTPSAIGIRSWQVLDQSLGAALRAPHAPDPNYAFAQSTFTFLSIAELLPREAVLRRPVQLRMAISGKLEKSLESHFGIYSRRDGEWSFVGNERDASGRFVASTRRLGQFAILGDFEQPKIVAPRNYSAKSTAPPPPLAARVTDSGSGIAIRDASIKIDGKKVPAEFSQEEKTLTWRPRKSLAKGKHFAQIEAKDRAGNRSSVVVPFEVR